MGDVTVTSPMLESPIHASVDKSLKDTLAVEVVEGLLSDFFLEVQHNNQCAGTHTACNAPNSGLPRR